MLKNEIAQDVPSLDQKAKKGPKKAEIVDIQKSRLYNSQSFCLVVYRWSRQLYNLTAYAYIYRLWNSKLRVETEKPETQIQKQETKRKTDIEALRKQKRKVYENKEKEEAEESKKERNPS